MPRTAAILIVEDEWIVARAVQKTLENAGYSVMGLASSAREALSLVDRQRPDLVLVDVVLEGETDGIDLAHQLRSRAGIPTIYVTAHTDEKTLARAMQTAPAGYVVKPFQESQLLSAVLTGLQRMHAAMGGGGGVGESQRGLGPHDDGDSDGGSTLRRNELRRVARALSEPRPSPGSTRMRLTARELEVVRLLLANGRVASIAERLRVSPATVRNHLMSVFRKLGVHSQVELIKELTEHAASDPKTGARVGQGDVNSFFK